jgi:hypothetical protein
LEEAYREVTSGGEGAIGELVRQLYKPEEDDAGKVDYKQVRFHNHRALDRDY